MYELDLGLGLRSYLAVYLTDRQPLPISGISPIGRTREDGLAEYRRPDQAIEELRCSSTSDTRERGKGEWVCLGRLVSWEPKSFYPREGLSRGFIVLKCRWKYQADARVQKE